MTKRYTGGVISSSLPTVNAGGASGVFTLNQQADAQSQNKWPPYKVKQSLRFRSSASAYLSRTPGSAGNRKTWTWSGWVKRGTLGVSDCALLAAQTDANNRFYARWESNDALYIYFNVSGTAYDSGTSMVFRDPSAWYHIVIAVDTTQATNTNRLKVYVNGVQQTLGTYSVPNQNTDTQWNNTVSQLIGKKDTANNFFDGYLAEVYNIDGQALTPASFGATDKDGNWSPISYTGTYGTNGFYLNFSDNTSATTTGYDYSGNSNHWTLNVFNVTTANTSYDIMLDVPEDQADNSTANNRGNYCTLNPLNPGQLGTLQSGNLEWIGGDQNNFRTVAAPILPTSGKYYWEVQPIGGGAGGAFVSGIYIGIMNYASGGTGLFASAARLADVGKDDYIYYNDGRKTNLNSFVSYGNSYVANDIIGIAVDIDNGKIWFSKNGTWQASGDPAAGTNAAYTTVPFSTKPYAPAMSAAEITNAQKFNFGQRPFSYAPPSGFKALNTYNLPDPTIKAPNQYFDALLYTGNGSSSQRTDISWTNMQPDMVWIKNRTTANNHVVHDVIRGPAFALQTNLTDATDGPVGFGSDGFGSDTGVSNQLRVYTNDGRYNLNNNSYVAWGWKAAASNTTNTSGSITSIVRANQTAGFSIVTYAGSGAAGTVGHGLGVAPAMIITKNRTTAGQAWPTWHKGMSNAYNSTTAFMYLDQTAGGGTTTNFYDGTAMTSSTFRWQTGNINVNASSNNYVSYVFAEIAGYSAFGSYTGNGSSDGPFIYTGFRPAFIIFKKISTTGNWPILDKSRIGYNMANYHLNTNVSDGEYTDLNVDLLSNGFKVRSSGGDTNQSGQTFIYMAFAESPFKYARAR